MLKDEAGDTVIEVELHSRLPVYAACTLSRHPTDAELPALQAALNKLPKDKLKFTPYFSYHVGLEPGEKKTFRLVVPPIPNGVKLAAQSTISASAPMYKLWTQDRPAKQGKGATAK